MKQVLSDIGIFLRKVGGVISRRDLIPKLMSLLLAVILWAYIGSTKLAEITLRLPIEIKNMPAHLVITKQNLTSITISLNGKKEEISGFNVKNVKAVVNLENGREGENLRYPIAIIKQEMPEGIRMGISRKYVTLSLEKRISRRVPVEPVLSENIKEGLVTGQVTMRPDTVVVSGEESLVKAIDSVRTEAIPVGLEAGKAEREVALDRSELRGLDLSAATVRVQLQVFEVDNLQKLEVALAVKNIRDGYHCEGARKKVRVFVKGEEQVAQSDLEAYLDLSRVNYALMDGRKEITVSLRVAVAFRQVRDGGAIMMISPSSLQVKIVKN